jgi:hypothetical protein
MFGKLEERMANVGWDSVKNYWDEDFKKRKIVSGFMKVRHVQPFFVYRKDGIINPLRFGQ